MLGGAFFPDFDETAGTLAAFATFAVGFAARPLGGIVFGRFGDRIGRKAVLIVSLLVMGIATFCVGILPGYATRGVAAPLLLVLLRFVQGVGLGGEWGDAVLMATEHAPKHADVPRGPTKAPASVRPYLLGSLRGRRALVGGGSDPGAFPRAGTSIKFGA